MSLYDTTAAYPRDLIGHGRDVPHARWPGGARVAVQFVLNYEEGGENSVLHGDAGSEQFLSEMFNPPAFPDRHISMEGIYEYGSRAGVWRLLREFERRGLPLTVFGVATALQRHTDVTAAFQELGFDIACHGLKWIHYQHIDEATERAHMQEAMTIIQNLTGEYPLGWYTGRDSPNTRRLQFIDFRLQWDGRLNRADLTGFFQISVPQASADISLYSELAPENLAYDRSSRSYLAAPGFVPLYTTSGAEPYMAQLLALQREALAPLQSFIEMRPPVASVGLPARHIDPGALKILLHAIAEQSTVRAHYQSITRDEPSWREISPHAFGHDGLRWHVRAYCHLRGGFRDFVLGRLLNVEAAGASSVKASSDVEWNTMVELELTPHPGLSAAQRHGVEVDYGMQDGKVALMCRQAMLFYTLRSLNFDFKGQPGPGVLQLCIANLDAIRHLLPRPGQK
jgi:peptidoglycan/xylan/chitin deacetylase (PgdA/CDA1 family)